MKNKKPSGKGTITFWLQSQSGKVNLPPSNKESVSVSDCIPSSSSQNSVVINNLTELTDSEVGVENEDHSQNQPSDEVIMGETDHVNNSQLDTNNSLQFQIGINGNQTDDPTQYKNPSDLPPPLQRKGKTITFQVHWYRDYPWLHYKPSTSAVYCFICLEAKRQSLFLESMRVKPAFVETGFRNWKKAIEKFKAHQNSAQHKDATLALAQRKQQGTVVDKLSESVISQQLNNRKALEKIISSVKFLAKQGLSLRGHEHDDGNLVELLELRKEDVPILQTWLTRHKSFTSGDIVNKYLEIMAHQVLRKLLKEIRESGIFSVIVDETTDLSTKKQVSISLRFVPEDTIVSTELYVGFYEVTETTAKVISDIVLDALKRFD